MRALAPSLLVLAACTGGAAGEPGPDASDDAAAGDAPDVGGEPGVSVSRPILVFPDGAATQEIGIGSTGDAPLLVAEVFVDGPAFGVHSSAEVPAFVPPGGTLVLEVAFLPPGTGAFDASLVVTTDGGLVSVPLHGAAHDLDLRVNHVQLKGTHNSYHVASPDPPPEWANTMPPLDVQLGELGVRHLELDVHRAEDGTWPVHHAPEVDPLSTCPDLAACLAIVRAFSDAHPWHVLLVVHVEPKDDFDRVLGLPVIAGHYDELDQVLLGAFPPGRVLRPDEVRGAHATLRGALDAAGWPTLAETRGRVMFVMLDSGEHREAYLEGHPNLEGRAMFVRDGAGEPWSSFVEPGDALGNEAISAQRALEGYLVRADADDPDEPVPSRRAGAEAALASGVHLVITDAPGGDPPSPSGYRFDLPGGLGWRCNPVTAPSGCEPWMVEPIPIPPR